jgi:hypothetical protein
MNDVVTVPQGGKSLGTKLPMSIRDNADDHTYNLRQESGVGKTGRVGRTLLSAAFDVDSRFDIWLLPG